MALNVQDFASNFKGGFRPTQFRVIMSFPAWVGTGPLAALQTPFMVQSTDLPASNMGTTPVPFRGRVFKYSGDRTFDAWQITVVADTDFVLRNAFEAWMNGMNDAETSQGRLQANEYWAKAYVHALDRKDKILYAYEMNNVFPTAVGGIPVDMNSTDTVATFPVTLEIGYFISLGNVAAF
jgi:hypothetical protein